MIHYPDEEITREIILEAVPIPGFVEFLDYFGRFSTSSLEGYIHCRYCPPETWIENRLKRTEKSTEPGFGTAS